MSRNPKPRPAEEFVCLFACPLADSVGVPWQGERRGIARQRRPQCCPLILKPVRRASERASERDMRSLARWPLEEIFLSARSSSAHCWLRLSSGRLRNASASSSRERLTIHIDGRVSHDTPARATRQFFTARPTVRHSDATNAAAGGDDDDLHLRARCRRPPEARPRTRPRREGAMPT